MNSLAKVETYHTHTRGGGVPSKIRCYTSFKKTLTAIQRNKHCLGLQIDEDFPKTVKMSDPVDEYADRIKLIVGATGVTEVKHKYSHMVGGAVYFKEAMKISGLTREELLSEILQTVRSKFVCLFECHKQDDPINMVMELGNEILNNLPEDDDENIDSLCETISDLYLGEYNSYDYEEEEHEHCEDEMELLDDIYNDVAAYFEVSDMYDTPFTPEQCLELLKQFDEPITSSVDILKLHLNVKHLPKLVNVAYCANCEMEAILGHNHKNVLTNCICLNCYKELTIKPLGKIGSTVPDPMSLTEYLDNGNSISGAFENIAQEHDLRVVVQALSRLNAKLITLHEPIDNLTKSYLKKLAPELVFARGKGSLVGNTLLDNLTIGLTANLHNSGETTLLISEHPPPSPAYINWNRWPDSNQNYGFRNTVVSIDRIVAGFKLLSQLEVDCSVVFCLPTGIAGVTDYDTTTNIRFDRSNNSCLMTHDMRTEVHYINSTHKMLLFNANIMSINDKLFVISRQTYDSICVVTVRRVVTFKDWTIYNPDLRNTFTIPTITYNSALGLVGAPIVVIKTVKLHKELLTTLITRNLTGNVSAKELAEYGLGFAHSKYNLFDKSFSHYDVSAQMIMDHVFISVLLCTRATNKRRALLNSATPDLTGILNLIGYNSLGYLAATIKKMLDKNSTITALNDFFTNNNSVLTEYANDPVWDEIESWTHTATNENIQLITHYETPLGCCHTDIHNDSCGCCGLGNSTFRCTHCANTPAQLIETLNIVVEEKIEPSEQVKTRNEKIFDYNGIPARKAVLPCVELSDGSHEHTCVVCNNRYKHTHNHESSMHPLFVGDCPWCEPELTTKNKGEKIDYLDSNNNINKPVKTDANVPNKPITPGPAKLLNDVPEKTERTPESTVPETPWGNSNRLSVLYSQLSQATSVHFAELIYSKGARFVNLYTITNEKQSLILYCPFGTHVVTPQSFVVKDTMPVANSGLDTCAYDALNFFYQNRSTIEDFKAVSKTDNFWSNDEIISVAELKKLNVVVLSKQSGIIHKATNSDEFAVIVHNDFLDKPGAHWTPAKVSQISNCTITPVWTLNADLEQYNKMSNMKYKKHYDLVKLDIEQLLTVNLEIVKISTNTLELLRHAKPNIVVDVKHGHEFLQTTSLSQDSMELETVEIPVKFSALMNLLNDSSKTVLEHDKLTRHYNVALTNTIDELYEAEITEAIRIFLKCKFGANITNYHKMRVIKRFDDLIELENLDLPKLKVGDIIHLSHQSNMIAVPILKTRHNTLVVKITGVRVGVQLLFGITKESAGSMIRRIFGLLRVPKLSNKLFEQLSNTECVLAVPGAGKTYEILNSYNAGDCIIAMTSHNKSSIYRRAKEMKKIVNVKSLEKFLSEGKKYKTVYLDECTLVKPFDGVLVLTLCDKMYAYGDNNQIPFVDMSQSAGTREVKNITDVVKPEKIETKLLSRRFGPSLVSELSPLIPGIMCHPSVEHDTDIRFANYEKNSIQVTAEIENNVRNFKPNVVLVFFQAKKAFWLKRLHPIVVETVHSYQGNEADNVVVIQEPNESTFGICADKKYVISAASRAVKHLFWISIGMYQHNKGLSSRVYTLSPQRGGGIHKTFNAILDNITGVEMVSNTGTMIDADKFNASKSAYEDKYGVKVSLANNSDGQSLEVRKVGILMVRFDIVNGVATTSYDRLNMVTSKDLSDLNELLKPAVIQCDKFDTKFNTTIDSQQADIITFNMQLSALHSACASTQVTFYNDSTEVSIICRTTHNKFRISLSLNDDYCLKVQPMIIGRNFETHVHNVLTTLGYQDGSEEYPFSPAEPIKTTVINHTFNQIMNYLKTVVPDIIEQKMSDSKKFLNKICELTKENEMVLLHNHETGCYVVKTPINYKCVTPKCTYNTNAYNALMIFLNATSFKTSAMTILRLLTKSLIGSRTDNGIEGLMLPWHYHKTHATKAFKHYIDKSALLYMTSKIGEKRTIYVTEQNRDKIMNMVRDAGIDVNVNIHRFCPSLPLGVEIVGVLMVLSLDKSKQDRKIKIYGPHAGVLAANGFLNLQKVRDYHELSTYELHAVDDRMLSSVKNSVSEALKKKQFDNTNTEKDDAFIKALETPNEINYAALYGYDYNLITNSNLLTDLSEFETVKLITDLDSIEQCTEGSPTFVDNPMWQFTFKIPKILNALIQTGADENKLLSYDSTFVGLGAVVGDIEQGVSKQLYSQLAGFVLRDQITLTVPRLNSSMIDGEVNVTSQEITVSRKLFRDCGLRLLRENHDIDSLLKHVRTKQHATYYSDSGSYRQYKETPGAAMDLCLAVYLRYNNKFTELFDTIKWLQPETVKQEGIFELLLDNLGSSAKEMVLNVVSKLSGIAGMNLPQKDFIKTIWKVVRNMAFHQEDMFTETMSVMNVEERISTRRLLMRGTKQILMTSGAASIDEGANKVTLQSKYLHKLFSNMSTLMQSVSARHDPVTLMKDFTKPKSICCICIGSFGDITNHLQVANMAVHEGVKVSLIFPDSYLDQVRSIADSKVTLVPQRFSVDNHIKLLNELRTDNLEVLMTAYTEEKGALLYNDFDYKILKPDLVVGTCLTVQGPIIAKKFNANYLELNALPWNLVRAENKRFDSLKNVLYRGYRAMQLETIIKQYAIAGLQNPTPQDIISENYTSVNVIDPIFGLVAEKENHSVVGFLPFKYTNSKTILTTKTCVLTLGSMKTKQHANKLISVAKKLLSFGEHVTIVEGGVKFNKEFIDRSDKLQIVSNVDYTSQLVHCKLMLHHCGSGTTHTAMLAGLPQILLPVDFDQPQWAGALNKKGYGVYADELLNMELDDFTHWFNVTLEKTKNDSNKMIRHTATNIAHALKLTDNAITDSVTLTTDITIEEEAIIRDNIHKCNLHKCKPLETMSVLINTCCGERKRHCVIGETEECYIIVNSTHYPDHRIGWNRKQHIAIQPIMPIPVLRGHYEIATLGYHAHGMCEANSESPPNFYIKPNQVSEFNKSIDWIDLVRLHNGRWSNRGVFGIEPRTGICNCCHRSMWLLRSQNEKLCTSCHIQINWPQFTFTDSVSTTKTDNFKAKSRAGHIIFELSKLQESHVLLDPKGNSNCVPNCLRAVAKYSTKVSSTINNAFIDFEIGEFTSIEKIIQICRFMRVDIQVDHPNVKTGGRLLHNLEFDKTPKLRLLITGEREQHCTLTAAIKIPAAQKSITLIETENPCDDMNSLITTDLIDNADMDFNQILKTNLKTFRSTKYTDVIAKTTDGKLNIYGRRNLLVEANIVFRKFKSHEMYFGELPESFNRFEDRILCVPTRTGNVIGLVTRLNNTEKQLIVLTGQRPLPVVNYVIDASVSITKVKKHKKLIKNDTVTVGAFNEKSRRELSTIYPGISVNRNCQKVVISSLDTRNHHLYSEWNEMHTLLNRNTMGETLIELYGKLDGATVPTLVDSNLTQSICEQFSRTTRDQIFRFGWDQKPTVETWTRDKPTGLFLEEQGFTSPENERYVLDYEQFKDISELNDTETMNKLISCDLIGYISLKNCVKYFEIIKSTEDIVAFTGVDKNELNRELIDYDEASLTVTCGPIWKGGLPEITTMDSLNRTVFVRPEDIKESNGELTLVWFRSNCLILTTFVWKKKVRGGSYGQKQDLEDRKQNIDSDNNKLYWFNEEIEERLEHRGAESWIDKGSKPKNTQLPALAANEVELDALCSVFNDGMRGYDGKTFVASEPANKKFLMFTEPDTPNFVCHETGEGPEIGTEVMDIIDDVDLADHVTRLAPKTGIIKSHEVPGRIVTNTKTTMVKYPEMSKPVITKGVYQTFNAVSSRLHSVVKYRKHKMDVVSEFDRCANCYFVPNYQHVLDEFKNDPITYNVNNIVDWVNRRKNSSVVAAELIELMQTGWFNHPINSVKVHSKLESLLKEDEIGYQYGQQKIRIIVHQTYAICAIFADIFLQAKERFKQLLGEKCVYADGFTLEELAARMRLIKSDKPLWVFERDFTKQDRQTDEDLINFEMYVYKQLGVHDDVISFWRKTHENWFYKGTDLSGSLSWMRLTGQCTTALGNAITNMVVNSRTYQEYEQNIKIMLLLGDDNSMISDCEINVHNSRKISRDYYNMESKDFCKKHTGIFLRMILHQQQDGSMSVCPDFLRLRRRYEVTNGVHKMGDEELKLRGLSYLYMLGRNKVTEEAVTSLGYNDELLPTYYNFEEAVMAVATNNGMTNDAARNEFNLLIDMIKANKSYDVDYVVTSSQIR
ncbi:replicase [Agaricus bisporus endornavirus 1]|uniref:Replicase n=1 Tax=Agaricus bisporus endornavirus 1 TaxID=1945738 RepID=A0A1Q1M959_9VIRU|nr:replicase [Agaricus bisporus endornavirus 1]AQM32768.1 replicase [Agaricus bisporus endornavirus 1]